MKNLKKFIMTALILVAVCICFPSLSAVKARAEEVDYSLISEEIMHNFMQSIIGSVSTREMTQDEQLMACYEFVLDWMTYQRDVNTPEGEWTKAYALEGFFTGRGNCYRYATTFGYLARELGYNVRICTGQCTASKGGWTPHGWAEIEAPDGTWKIYDLSFGDSNRGKRNFFGITEEEHPRRLKVDNVWELTY